MGGFSVSGSWMGLGNNQQECDFMGDLISFSYNGFGNLIPHVVCRWGSCCIWKVSGFSVTKRTVEDGGRREEKQRHFL